MNKEELKEFIVTALKELDDPFMDPKKREAAQAGTKAFLYRLGVRMSDDEDSRKIYKAVFQALLNISKNL